MAADIHTRMKLEAEVERLTEQLTVELETTVHERKSFGILKD